MGGDNKIRAILENEIVLLVRIIGFVAGIIMAFCWIKMDIALIQKDISVMNNTLNNHMNDYNDELILRRENQELILQRIEDLKLDVVELQTLINK